MTSVPVTPVSTLAAVLWIAAVSLPALVVLALLVAPVRRRRPLVTAAPIAVAPAGLLALLGPSAGSVDVPWLLLGTSLTVTPLGRPLLLLAVVLYAGALAAVAAGGPDRRHLLTGFLLVAFVGNAGVFVAADTVTFYLSFALMSVAAFGCVVHTRSESARRAGRVYLALTMLSELAVLCGLVLVVNAGGREVVDAPAAVAASEHRPAILALLLIGFGIKAGTVPLHVWLPLAHPAAPPPASAVLSGAMVKAGLFGWLTFLPLGEVALPGWGTTLVVLALVGAFAALPLGVLHADPKVPLAYSTISQMGFLAVLVGIALTQPELADVCALAAVVYAVHHGVAKGGLFLGVSVWQRHGAGRARPLVLAVLAVLALAVAGAPFGSGSVAKYAAKEAVAPASLGGVELVDLLPWVGTVSTLLLARAGWVLLRGRTGPARRVDVSLVSWCLLTVAGTVATWALADRWSDVVTVPGLDLVTLWDATWPIMIGLVIAAVVGILAEREFLPPRLAHPDGSLIPAGDLAVPEERIAGRAARALVTVGAGRSAAVGARLVDAVGPLRRSTVVDDAERGLSRWAISGAAVVTVAALAVLLVVIA